MTSIVSLVVSQRLEKRVEVLERAIDSIRRLQVEGRHGNVTTQSKDQIMNSLKPWPEEEC